jgi:GDPmannose 4,6-dehydratase
MWLMLQTDTPEDFVIGTGASATVRDFLDFAFQEAGLDWQKYVKFDDRYVRPTEVDSLIGDASKAQKKLNWKHTLDVAGLASLMVKHDIESVSKNSHFVDIPKFI